MYVFKIMSFDLLGIFIYSICSLRKILNQKVEDKEKV